MFLWLVFGGSREIGGASIFSGGVSDRNGAWFCVGPVNEFSFVDVIGALDYLIERAGS